MTFKEKIDKILENNKLGISSVHALEKHLNLGVGAITKKYSKNEVPGPEVIKKIKDGLRINNEWWNTGEGDIFPENGAVDSMGNSLIEFISKFEEKTSYKFIPKTILDEEYRIVLKSEIDSREAYIKKLIEWAEKSISSAEKNVTSAEENIAAKEKLIEQLEKENALLKGVHSKKAQ